MNIPQLKKFAESKLAALRNDQANAQLVGNVEEYNRLESEINETVLTIDLLNTL